MPVATNGGGGSAPVAPVATTTTVKKTSTPKPAPVPKVVTSKTGQIAKVKAPVPPSSTDLNKYLGTDTTYEQTLAGQQKSLADFLASQNTQRVQNNTDYANNKHQLGQQENVDQQGQLDNFAGRGIAHSSIYGDALSNLLRGYTDKYTNLDSQNNKFLSQLSQNKQTFLDSQLAAKQNAQSQAAARRAAQIAAQAASATVVKGP